MLASSFGRDFSAHNQESIARKKITAAHISFYHIRKICPKCRLITIFRDPVERLRSVMGHFYARRDDPKYHRVGHIIAAMVMNKFEPDDYLMRHPLVLKQCDNVLTRFLCSSPVEPKVTNQHLYEALTNLGSIDELILNDKFTEGVQELWGRFGLPCPEIMRENRGILRHPLFDDVPAPLEQYVRYDRQLFTASVNNWDRRISRG